MPVPIMFAITMHVAVSKEMRWELPGITRVVRKFYPAIDLSWRTVV
jgi:hypothetical protein